MTRFKFYRKDNYIVVVNELTQETQYGFVKEVRVDKSNLNKASYRIFEVKDFDDKNSLVIDQLLKEDGTPYTQGEFETFYTQNTGNFNQGGSGSPGVQSVTGDSVDNSDPNNPVINAVEEAPNDGNQYARQDEAWAIITSGSQNLQQTMDNGRYWIDSSDPDNIIYFSAGSPDIQDDVFAWQGKTNSFAISSDKFNLLAGNQTDDAEDPTVPRIQLIGEIPLENGVLIFNLPNDKPFNGIGGTFSGTYTIATKEDINFQQAITNSAFASGANSAFAELNSPIDGHVEIEMTPGDENSSVIILHTTSDIGDSYMRVESGQVSLTSNNVIEGNITEGTVFIVDPQEEENIVAQFRLPVNKTIAQLYTLVTEDDLTDYVLKEDRLAVEIVTDLTKVISNPPTTLMLSYTTAASNVTTLPNPTLNAGTIIFFTNKLAGVVTLNSIDGTSNHIWDGGTATNTYSVPSGTTARLICDGLTYNVL